MEKVIANKEMVSDFRGLDVYKKAYIISKEVYKKSLTFPKFEQYSLADQMRRASRSVCANLAEGYAKQGFSKREFGRFLSMAIGSATEMMVWSDYSLDFEYIDRETYAKWSGQYNEILRMPHGLRRKI